MRWIYVISVALWTAVYGAAEGSCNSKITTPVHLRIIESPLQIEGKTTLVYEVVTADGSKILKKREGECFDVVVDNQISLPTALHWHGLILPCLQDGVPYLTQEPIHPGMSYPYHFPIVQNGTYFAHSHFGLQGQKLMSIPILLLPKEESSYRDIVVFLEDFTFKTPEEIWQNLRKSYVAMAKEKGSSWSPDLSPAMMHHGKPDLNDVQYDAYLANRTTLENPDVFTVKPSEVVRLRLINGSTASNFKVLLGSIKGQVVAVDGHLVKPLLVNEVPLATAQRVDMLITVPLKGECFPILVQGEGTDMQTGILLMIEGGKKPVISSRAKTTLGALDMHFESQLEALHPLVQRKIDRTLRIELDGNMPFYTWGLNKSVWPKDKPLFVKEGERVEMVFVNKTQMAHPMHLHGHVFQIMEIEGRRFSGAMRDTVLVLPGQTVKVELDANNPGVWALHCHLAYHQWAGMFTVVQYEGFTPPEFPMQVIDHYARLYGGY